MDAKEMTEDSPFDDKLEKSLKIAHQGYDRKARV